MVRIIDDSRPFEGRCNVCGTTFEYDVDDMKQHYKGPNGEDFSYIECPVCKMDVTNIWHNLPEIQPFLY